MTPRPVTLLLEASARGDSSATEELLPVVYDELRRLAGSLMSNEPAGHTLQPTALVHEAYLRLVGPGSVSWQNRAHFFGAAALAMRRILIDRARRARAARTVRSAIEQDIGETAGGPETLVDEEDLLHLDAALDELRARDERQHDVVMLRYFAGLTIEHTALAIGLSTGTVKNEWSYARAWLLHRIERLRAAEAGTSGGAGA